MKDMVYFSGNVKDEPYTTADAIAQFAQIHHKTINKLIQQHQKDLEEFGVLRFEIALPPQGSKGGRPEKYYHLNEQQATLLITYLKNTPTVQAFKKELVHQFYSMRKELTKRRSIRAELRPTSKTLADAIKACTDPEHLHTWTYSNYFSLAHRAALGISTDQIKKHRSIPKGANVPDYLSATELKRVGKAEAAIMALLEMGLDYKQIKASLLQIHKAAA